MFTSFEVQVLEALLRGNEPRLERLRTQLERAAVTGRTRTGAGCYVDINVEDNPADRVSPPSFYVADVHLELEDASHGAAAILFITHGRMTMLELVAYADPWPDEPEVKRISYLSAGGLRAEREIGELASSIDRPRTSTK